MAAILNSAILDLAILDSAILVFPSNSLTLAKIGSHHLHKLTFIHSFWLNLMMAAILNSAILDSAILQKKLHSFILWLNLMMAAILNSAMLDSDTAILDSDTLLSSLRFTQKHSHSTLTLTQTNSIWLKLIHSHLTWWWQPSLNSAILNLAILDSAILVFPLKLTHTCQDWFPPFAQKKLHSFILTQLDDGSHLEFCHVGFRHCHLGFRHLVIFSQIHSKTLSLHSDSDSN